MINLYTKTDKDISLFETLLPILQKYSEDIYITTEHKRSFYEFKKIQKSYKKNDIIAIIDLSDLGLNNAEAANVLEWFLINKALLVILNMPTTYEFGIKQPTNQAVLQTIVQTILSTDNNVVTFIKPTVGRSKIQFPFNWDELYEDWENGKISSKKFLEESKLKKATFYNMITEYKKIQETNKKYIKLFKKA